MASTMKMRTCNILKTKRKNVASGHSRRAISVDDKNYKAINLLDQCCPWSCKHFFSYSYVQMIDRSSIFLRSFSSDRPSFA